MLNWTSMTSSAMNDSFPHFLHKEREPGYFVSSYSFAIGTGNRRPDAFSMYRNA